MKSPSKILIAGREFKNKTAAKEFVGSIRDRYTNGATLGPLDESLLTDLLALHPEASDKIGPGISHFSIATDSVFGRTRHFVVHRTDGTSTDFSFHSCIDGPNPRRDSLKALRCAVTKDILDFGTATFITTEEPRCPFLGTILQPGNYHVDHVPPHTFLALANAWLAISAITLWDVEISPPQDNQLASTMTNATQRDSWAAYHRANAILRLTSPLGNLSHSKRITL